MEENNSTSSNNGAGGSSTLSLSTCLFCKEGVEIDDGRRSTAASKLWQGGSGRGNGNGCLEAQVSVFFLLRKVLGLSPEFLESLLVSCGSPSEWNIKLCRGCKRRLGEAEYLWDRMRQLQRDYEKVTYEIKDTLINSISVDEANTLNATMKEDARKNLLLEKLQSCQISEGIRVKFFTDLQDEVDDSTTDHYAHIPVLSAAGPPGNFTKVNGLKWNEKGIPYVPLAELESKMKELVDTATTAMQNCRKAQHSNLPSPKAKESGDHNSQNSEEESLIRIVPAETIMEEIEDEVEEKYAIPPVEVVLEHDSNDGAKVVSGGGVDPMSSDRNDPDYVPADEEGPTTETSDKSRTSKRSRLNSLKIKVIKKSSNDFQCSKCLATFATRNGCQIHILRDHYAENEAFHCHLCSEKFRTYPSLRGHVRSSHGKTETPYDDDASEDAASPSNIPIFKCPAIKCSDIFTSKRALQKHTSTVHGSSLAKLTKTKKSEAPSPPPGLECEICSARNIEYRAENKDILDIHYKKLHNQGGTIRTRIIAKPQALPKDSGSASMTCPDCGMILPNSSAMAEHLKNPANKCSECSTHFLYKIDLRRHLELNHSDSKLQCPYCTKSFTSKLVYEKHIENHQCFDIHECQVCHVKVTGLGTLTRHIDHAHPEYFQQQQLQLQNPEVIGL